jgi:lipid-A-disaccharide synthase
VGHPLIDAIHNHPIVDSTKFRIENQLDDKPLSPYPGSRKQEIKNACGDVKYCRRFS